MEIIAQVFGKIQKEKHMLLRWRLAFLSLILREFTGGQAFHGDFRMALQNCLRLFLCQLLIDVNPTKAQTSRSSTTRLPFSTL